MCSELFDMSDEIDWHHSNSDYSIYWLFMSLWYMQVIYIHRYSYTDMWYMKDAEFLFFFFFICSVRCQMRLDVCCCLLIFFMRMCMMHDRGWMFVFVPVWLLDVKVCMYVWYTTEARLLARRTRFLWIRLHYLQAMYVCTCMHTYIHTHTHKISVDSATLLTQGFWLLYYSTDPPFSCTCLMHHRSLMTCWENKACLNLRMHSGSCTHKIFKMRANVAAGTPSLSGT